MDSETRLRPCARLACNAKRNQASTGSCCDGISVSFFGLPKDSPLMVCKELSRSHRASLDHADCRKCWMRLDRPPAEEYNVLRHNGKPLLSKKSVSARKCLWESWVLIHVSALAYAHIGYIILVVWDQRHPSGERESSEKTSKQPALHCSSHILIFPQSS